MAGAAGAVQVPGVTPPLPPGVERRFEFFVGNDALSIGNYPDDYRTQQFAVAFALGDRWNAVIDHSILTLEEPGEGAPGRQDQLSASLGYTLWERRGSSYRQEFEIGGGLRIYGDLDGSRIQNGFHQLTGNDIKTMPYVDNEHGAGTFWLRAQRDGTLVRDFRVPGLGRQWSLDYWGRAAALATTAGQWDGNVGLMAVVGKRWFQAWLGVEADWRVGYDRNNVERETAQHEEGIAGVLGLRFGPFRVETQREIGGDSLYGHASFVSSGESLRGLADGDNRFGLQFGLTMPDVYLTLQGRWANCNVLGCSAERRRALVVGVQVGSPQVGGDTSRFVDTWQVSAMLELEHAPLARWPWMTGYGGLGAGWRSERIEVDTGQLAGATSDSVDRPGLVAEAGLRFSTVARSSRWSLLLQVGIAGWLPSSDGHVQVGDDVERLQTPELVVTSGLLLRFDP